VLGRICGLFFVIIYFDVQFFPEFTMQDNLSQLYETKRTFNAEKNVLFQNMRVCQLMFRFKRTKQSYS
jgi:hypothetical protein